MLALNGGIRIWHISDVVDMRYGKYRLLKVIEEKHLNPFNGDAYVFLSRNRKNAQDTEIRLRQSSSLRHQLYEGVQVYEASF